MYLIRVKVTATCNTFYVLLCDLLSLHVHFNFHYNRDRKCILFKPVITITKLLLKIFKWEVAWNRGFKKKRNSNFLNSLIKLTRLIDLTSVNQLVSISANNKWDILFIHIDIIPIQSRFDNVNMRRSHHPRQLPQTSIFFLDSRLFKLSI